MNTAGIDVGYEAIKIVLFKDGEVIAKNTGLSGGINRVAEIDRLWKETLDSVSMKPEDFQGVVATGLGKNDVAFADSVVTEPIADTRAARWFFADATSVIDVGADRSRVVTLKDGEGIEEIALSQKCGNGFGSQLKFIARKLEMTMDELSDIPEGVADGAVCNDGCIVFIELDAIELLAQGVPSLQVAGAVVDAIAVRINMLLNDKITPKKETTLLIGGVSQNDAVVKSLKSRSGIDFIIPEDAVFGGAIGCALIAAERKAREE